jgi:tetratricopeptide (TPR) repeat protein
MKNQPDPEALLLLGIYYGEQGNVEKQEKCYRECARTCNWAGPLFNLALAQKSRRQFADAMETINECLRRRSDGPTLTLKAAIAEGQNFTQERDDSLAKGLACFSGPRAMSDWELGWYVTAARMAGDKPKLEEASAEQKRRRQLSGQPAPAAGQLPDLSPTLAAR